MPFREIDLDKEIEKQKAIDSEFKKAWDEHEYNPAETSWEKFKREHFTDSEIKESKRRVKKMLKRDKQRQKKKAKRIKEINKKLR